MATKEQIEAGLSAWQDYMRKTHRDFAKESEAVAAIIDAAQTPLLQEIAALKGDLRLEDLPPEGARTKLDEWQACYAALFRQMNEAIVKQAPLMEVIQDASDFLKSIEGAGYGGISRYDVLCVRLEEALKGNTGNAQLLEAADRMRDCAESYADALHEPDERLRQQLHHDVVMAIADYDADTSAACTLS